ncbi:MAG: SUMF1/EgtB/PvdO family nonheme iron enzyme [Anaerolineae bacterium]|nr:SUMF1/EgtB/PvdO family nonheme iron enzyme [Anaerolineae bacterium]
MPGQVEADTARLIRQIKRALGLEVEPTPVEVRLPEPKPSPATPSRNWQIGGALLAVIALLGVVLTLLNNLPSSLNPTPTTAVAVIPSQTPGIEPTAFDPVQIVGLTQTFEAGQTLTTINATVDAIATGTRAAQQTAEAATLTAMPTRTPTLSPLQATYAAETGYDYRAGNAAWTPITQDFDGVTMVLVPAGSFDMGSTQAQIDQGFAMCQQTVDNNATCERDQFEAERIPVGGNTQTLASFWLDQTEVTRAMYQQCVTAGDCEVTPDSNYSTQPDQPINNVNWVQAQNYCTWRDARLPTEAEWEYAARGPDELLFPWGNTFDGSRANHCDSNCGAARWASGYDYVNQENDDGYAATAPVGSYPAGASWVGALDLSGNVWEWVSSLAQSYPYRATDGRENLANRTDLRVLRGGAFYSPSYNLRTVPSTTNSPTAENENYGFRCARSS